MKFEWELILNRGSGDQKQINSRAKVIGGWIVKDVYYDMDDDIDSRNIVFIPDPEHKWVIEQ